MTRADRHNEISFTPPMECLAINNPTDGPGWTYELKLDGYRGQAIRDSRGAHLLSRNGKDFVIGGFTSGSNGIDALVVGFYSGRSLLYAARVRAGLIPATRRMHSYSDITSCRRWDAHVPPQIRETLTHTFLEFFVISLDAHKPLGVYLCAPRGPPFGPR